MAAAALQPMDYTKITKNAIGAGLLTLVLASLIVGIETISSTAGIAFETRYRAVFCAAIGVAIIYFLAQMIKAGRPLVPLIVGGALTALMLILALGQADGWAIASLVPFESPVVNWAVLLVPASIVIRSALVMWRGAGDEGGASQREASFSTYYRRINKQFAILLIAAAIIFPFLPFADRRL